MGCYNYSTDQENLNDKSPTTFLVQQFEEALHIFTPINKQKVNQNQKASKMVAKLILLESFVCSEIKSNNILEGNS